MSEAVLLARGDAWAVYAKPAGMTVVGGRGVVRPTLLDVALENLGAAKPVHRLDKPTTGCCIVATTTYGQQILSDAFRHRRVDKRYVAIVEGDPTFKELVVDARLARVDDPDMPRAPGKRKAPLAIQTIDESGDRALTRLKVLARGDGIALVEARPETGRMHQIRCHLQHVGLPIVGDRLYGAHGPFIPEQELALHAWGVAFPRPEGGRAAVTAPLPSGWWPFALERRLALGAIGELMERFAALSTPTKAATATSTTPARSAATTKAPQRTGRGATPPTTRHEPPQSKRGARGARSGPSRRGGPPGR
jgi:23S rRNA-/tRNA-specific pseudouridylate synthase